MEAFREQPARKIFKVVIVSIILVVAVVAAVTLVPLGMKAARANAVEYIGMPVLAVNDIDGDAVYKVNGKSYVEVAFSPFPQF